MREPQDLLSGVALTVFKLNGQFLSVAEDMARPVGITAAWWQVLGAVLDEPLSVSGIAREMGITRQSVQRIANILVSKGLAEYLPNPAHRRAKLVRPTGAGREAVARIDPAHAQVADKLADELGIERFREMLDTLTQLSEVLDSIQGEPASRELAEPRTEISGRSQH